MVFANQSEMQIAYNKNERYLYLEFTTFLILTLTDIVYMLQNLTAVDVWGDLEAAYW